MPADTDLHTDPKPPLVRTRGRIRTLEFTPGEIQSEMHLDAPHRITLDYVRAMLCFVLFQPRPAHIVMIGLGGGSLAKFCHRYLPHSRITVVELRADVIALRNQFAVPPDSERFQVVHGDGAALIATMARTIDVLLIDGFDRDGLPEALCSEQFYRDCRRALRHGGVLAANVFSYDPKYPMALSRLQHSFQRNVCSLHGIAGNNRILFAVKATEGGPPTPSLRMLARIRRIKGRGIAWAMAHRLLAHWLVLRTKWLAGQ
ncbi:fused MFS/spermidine synthase [Pseudoduganella ginsengisoli]|uniref:Transferase spermidine synthase n=1 Tax=Pseudoduganella ginsengisoli TaxID=1462440 RepID=A0A6L6Q1I4_9BURK|nr:transferase spermidine synthase [Pseudoduganella ginsengisoli]MTW03396.1 transferase spermidine synthase [Pseudoduganella ginsengisoli]